MLSTCSTLLATAVLAAAHGDHATDALERLSDRSAPAVERVDALLELAAVEGWPQRVASFPPPEWTEQRPPADEDAILAAAVTLASELLSRDVDPLLERSSRALGSPQVAVRRAGAVLAAALLQPPHRVETVLSGLLADLPDAVRRWARLRRVDDPPVGLEEDWFRPRGSATARAELAATLGATSGRAEDPATDRLMTAVGAALLGASDSPATSAREVLRAGDQRSWGAALAVVSRRPLTEHDGPLLLQVLGRARREEHRMGARALLEAGSPWPAAMLLEGLRGPRHARDAARDLLRRAGDDAVPELLTAAERDEGDGVGRLALRELRPLLAGVSRRAPDLAEATAVRLLALLADEDLAPEVGPLMDPLGEHATVRAARRAWAGPPGRGPDRRTLLARAPELGPAGPEVIARALREPAWAEAALGVADRLEPAALALLAEPVARHVLLPRSSGELELLWMPGFHAPCACAPPPPRPGAERRHELSLGVLDSTFGADPPALLGALGAGRGRLRAAAAWTAKAAWVDRWSADDRRRAGRALLDLLRSGPPGARTAATCALERDWLLAAADFVPDLSLALGGPSEVTRRCASEALLAAAARVDTPWPAELLPAVVLRLDARDPHERDAVAACVAAFGGAAVDPLAGVLGGRRAPRASRARELAATALAILATHDGDPACRASASAVLEHALGSGDPPVRRAVVGGTLWPRRLLASWRPPGRLSIRLLSDPEPSVRTAALTWLARPLEPPAALGERLPHLLVDPVEDVRLNAVHVLQRFGARLGRADLRDLLADRLSRDESAQVRSWAFAALAEARGPLGADELVAGVRALAAWPGPAECGRAHVAGGLDLARHVALPDDAEALAALEEALREEPALWPVAVRLDAVGTRQLAGPVERVLTAALGEPDPGRRAAAARALEAAPPPSGETRRRLVALALDDAHPAVRRSAARAVRPGPDGRVDDLLRLLEADDGDVRLEAAIALVDRTPVRARRGLLEGLASALPRRRHRAAEEVRWILAGRSARASWTHGATPLAPARDPGWSAPLARLPDGLRARAAARLQRLALE